MARILEDQAKKLFARVGLSVPTGRAFDSIEGIEEYVEELGRPVVVKALVPVGKRGKAGAVQFANTPKEAVQKAGEVLGKTVRGFRCQSVLVEERLSVARELYASVTFDSLTRNPVVLASSQGGVDVEELAARSDGALVRQDVDILDGFQAYQAREMWENVGLDNQLLGSAAKTLTALYDLFRRYDVSLVEINPIIVTTDNRMVAADAVLVIDDEALFRQPEMQGLTEYMSELSGRPPTDLERQVIEADQADPYRGTARFIEFESGDIGFMCGGGGGSLVMMDTLIRHGGRPKNYTEMGGNPTKHKIYVLAKTVLSQPGLKGFIRAGNISSNTQVDLVASALVEAINDLGIDPKQMPMVVRAAGLNEEEGRRILREAGIDYFSDEITMPAAARLLLEKMAASEGGKGC